MQTVKFILVCEAGTQNAAYRINNCHLPNIGQHVIVNGSGHTGITDTTDIKQCETLLRELCELRQHHPEAKILGISELGAYSVHSSDAMNRLRRHLSDLP